MSWGIFNPKEENFITKENYNKFRERARCALCHKKLDVGDEYDLRPIDTQGRTALAVVVHRKCIERG